MNLCPDCSGVYHGQGRNPSPKNAAVPCEACGGPSALPRAGIGRPLAAIGLCFGLLAAFAAFGGKAAILSVIPGAGPVLSALGVPLALDGPAIEGVHARLATEGGKSLLVVEGEIVNRSAKEAAIAELAVALVSADGAPLYSWRAHAGKARLEPGERLAFRTRLESPPAGIAQALVKFSPVGDKFALAGENR